MWVWIIHFNGLPAMKNTDLIVLKDDEVCFKRFQRCIRLTYEKKTKVKLEFELKLDRMIATITTPSYSADEHEIVDKIVAVRYPVMETADHL